MEYSFGNFLKQKRQEKKLTQKALAKVLSVSESAVSKWEKDIAHPDITLLPKLSELLGVTEHELITASIDKQCREEKVQAKKWRVFSLSWNLFFYIAYAIALLTCFICDLAINRGLTWFWIVVSSLVLAFTFTNLPTLIKKNKLILLPLSMFLSLCLLLGVCCVYTRGSWFGVASVSVLLGLVIVFLPIYISKYKIFAKVKKYNDYISISIDFLMINILLVVIKLSTSSYSNASSNWYLTIALPITLVLYGIINILVSLKFLKVNKLLKTSLILFIIDLFVYLPPIVIKVKNPVIQSEILDDVNIIKTDFSAWNVTSIDNNINCIICMTIMLLSIIFLIVGFARYLIVKRQNRM